MKRFNVSIFALLFLLVIPTILNATGNGLLPDTLSFADRFRNTPAISDVDSKTMYFTSFGLYPYRLSSTLLGRDALAFKGNIENSDLGWNFTHSCVIYFDENFELNVQNTLPSFVLNGYQQIDLPNLTTYFGLPEGNARYDGASGSWASPVLNENANELIVLNKSGVLMGMDTNMSGTVNWFVNLRDIERAYKADHYKYEYMATPTLINDKLYVAGISGVFEVPLSDPSQPTYSFINLSAGDHFFSPVSFNNHNANSYNFITCVSLKGNVVTFDPDFDPRSEILLDTNISVTSKPLYDADGQIYIASSNSKIYYYPEPFVNSINDFSIIDLSSTEANSVTSSLITDSSKKIYGFTRDNKIISCKETYDYDNTNIVQYNWDNQYLYQPLMSSSRVFNNHSVLFENFDNNTSCLVSISNASPFFDIQQENYYTDYNPQGNSICVDLINTLNPAHQHLNVHGNNACTFGGLAPYITNFNEYNAIWLDENGFAWTWRRCAPTESVSFDLNVTELIPATGNPKYMRDLSNITQYNCCNFQIVVNSANVADFSKAYINSYQQTYMNQVGSDVVFDFRNILPHHNVQCALIPSQGNPFVFENIDLSSGALTLDLNHTVLSNETISQDASYINLTVNNPAILTINSGASVICSNLYLYNGASIIVEDGATLHVGGTCYSQANGNTASSFLKNGIASSPGSIFVNEMDITSGGNCTLELNSFGSCDFNDLSIDNTGTLTNQPIFLVSDCSVLDIQESIQNNGVINIDNYLTCKDDCVVDITGSTAVVNVSASLELIGTQFEVTSGADVIMGEKSNLILKNRSSVIIDGPGSLFKIGCESTILGESAGYLTSSNSWIPGDCIIAHNQGVITTEDYVNFVNNPTDNRITITNSGSEFWDGIFIKHPADDVDYWFVNCNISGIRKLTMEWIDDVANPRNATLNLYKTNFHDAGQIIVRGNQNLVIDSDETAYCEFYNNKGCMTYMSQASIKHVLFGGQNGGNTDTVYLYGSASNPSIIDSCMFINNSGNGVTLNGVCMDEFILNEIRENTGFGMFCYDGTTFDAQDFKNIIVADNGLAEYVGWQSTFFMNSPATDIVITDSDYGAGSDYYLLMNVNWDGLTQVDISGTNITSAVHLFPEDSNAWSFGELATQSAVLLETAQMDFSNGNYDHAEIILHQILDDFTTSPEANMAAYYLYHIECITDNDYDGLLNYLESLNPDQGSDLYLTIEKISAKLLIKDKDYLAAIDILEDIIINSTLPDDVVAAMIDQGYCYLCLSESGERNLPVNCSVKTATLDEYQAKVKELESQFSFYPKEPINHQVPQPETVSALRNYPNPFNPVTTVSFSLSSESKVSVDVFNIKGQKVKQILNEKLTSGTHEIQWDGRDASNKASASGVYFVKVATEKDTDIRKMLLLK